MKVEESRESCKNIGYQTRLLKIQKVFLVEFVCFSFHTKLISHNLDLYKKSYIILSTTLVVRMHPTRNMNQLLIAVGTKLDIENKKIQIKC